MARVVISDVSRRYGPRWALAHVDFTISEGEGCMLTGPNGSGKSTLIRCLATALRAHKGDILLNGESLWPNRSRLRSQIAYLGHAHHVWDDLSAVENLRAWKRMGGSDASIDGLLQRVGLEPDRIDPVRTFSAGMRRRLALARMLMKQPRLVLMDEPFTALDPGGRELTIEVVNQLREGGATLVMATHLSQVAARCCERTVALEGGQVIYDGSPDGAPIAGVS